MDNSLDILCQLRLWPDHAINPESGEAARLGLQKIVPRHEADGPGMTNLTRHRAAHDVHFIEAGARHEEVGTLDIGADEHVTAGRGAQHELHIKRLEPIGNLRGVVDDEDVVVSR